MMGPSHTVDLGARTWWRGKEGDGGILRSRRQCERAHSSPHSWISVCFNHTANEQTPAAQLISDWDETSFRFFKSHTFLHVLGSAQLV